jgi:hypothetical protein
MDSRARKRTIQPGNIRRSLSQHDQSRNSVAQSPRERQVGKARAYYQDCSIYPFVGGQIERTPFVGSELNAIAGRLQQPRDLGSKRRPLRYNQYELSEFSHPIFRPVPHPASNRSTIPNCYILITILTMARLRR